MSSGAGVTGVKGGAHYSAAKSGLQMFTRVTAAEWGPHGIRCNCVAVGLVGSERAVAAWEVANLDHERMATNVPLGRAGTAGRGGLADPLPRQRRGVVRERPDVCGGRRTGDEWERRLNAASVWRNS